MRLPSYPDLCHNTPPRHRCGMPTPACCHYTHYGVRCTRGMRVRGMVWTGRMWSFADTTALPNWPSSRARSTYPNCHGGGDVLRFCRHLWTTLLSLQDSMHDGSGHGHHCCRLPALPFRRRWRQRPSVPELMRACGGDSGIVQTVQARFAKVSAPLSSCRQKCWPQHSHMRACVCVC